MRHKVQRFSHLITTISMRCLLVHQLGTSFTKTNCTRYQKMLKRKCSNSSNSYSINSNCSNVLVICIAWLYKHSSYSRCRCSSSSSSTSTNSNSSKNIINNNNNSNNCCNSSRISSFSLISLCSMECQDFSLSKKVKPLIYNYFQTPLKKFFLLNKFKAISYANALKALQTKTRMDTLILSQVLQPRTERRTTSTTKQ